MTEPIANKRVNAAFGRLFLFSAAILSCLIFADRWTDMPIRFPSFWYTSRGLHLAICVGLYICAWLALRNTSVSESIDAPEPLFKSFNFYTRPDCGLCHEALEALKKYSQFLPTPNILNIDEDECLRKKFTDCIPVVELDGRVVFRGKVSLELMDRLISAKQNQRLNEMFREEENEGQGE